jgi:uronate dehydrogenase
VYASSVHAMMGYPVDHQAHADDPPRADTLYGVTKVYGEALCSSYAYLHRMSCMAVRIGAYVPDDEREKRVYCSDNPQLLDIVVSRRDLCDLLHRCIMAPDDLKYAIFHGISNNRFKRMDIENARELLGYEPKDDSFEWSKIVDFGPEEKV